MDIDLTDHSRFVAGVPHGAFAHLRRHEPVRWQEGPDPGGFYSLVRHADVLAASKDWQTFSAARGGIVLEDQPPDRMEQTRTQLLSMDPPQHRQLRNRVLTAFTPASINSMEQWLRDRAREIMDDAAERGACDFVTDMANELPMQTINQMMAIPDSDRTKIVEWANAVIASAGETEARRREADVDPGQALGAYGYQLAVEREGKGGSDLISLMLDAELDGERLDAVGFSGLFVQIAVAGNETTRSMLAGVMHLLAERPDLIAELANLDRIPPTAVEEMLRWTTPVHYFRRTTNRDVAVRGVTIPEGSRVLLWYTAANFDDDVFDRPDEFDWRRDPNPQLAFGWGEHFCLGARLARLEATVFWEEFFARFRGAELAGPVGRLASNLTNTYLSLPVTLEVR